MLGLCFRVILSTHETIKRNDLRFVVFYQCFDFNKLLFGHWELFPTCHVLIFNNIEFLHDLSNKSKRIPIPQNIFLQTLLTLSIQFFNLFSLFILKIETDFSTPFNFIWLYLPIIEIAIFNIIDTISTTNWTGLWQVILWFLGGILFLWLLLLFVLFLMLLLCYTLVGNINTMMVEKFTKWCEISWVHKRSKTSTNCMYINPLIILLFKNVFPLLKKLFIFIHDILELFPLSFEVLSFQWCCSFYTFIVKLLKLIFLPKWQDIDLFTEEFYHLVPNIVIIFFWIQKQQISDQNAILP